jgi:elongator complex protein 3
LSPATKSPTCASFSKTYSASGGTEYFLSFETRDKKTLYAFLRLRLTAIKAARAQRPALSVKTPTRVSLPALTPNTALIRELHTYGQSLPIQRKTDASSSLSSLRAEGHTRPKTVQHSGLGHRLMLEAEKIAKTKGYKKISVISGVGVKEYYRKLGYRLENTYMVKDIK